MAAGISGGSLGFEVDGLKESMRFLGKVGPELRKEAVDVIKKRTLVVKSDAQGRLAATPGVRRSKYPGGKTAIVHRASTTGAAVGINRNGRNPSIFAAEFGAYRQWVARRYGRTRGEFWPQNAMKRRTFPVYRGNQFKPRGGAGPGWIVQPTIRRHIDSFDEGLANDLMPVFDKAARRAGVPRGR